MSKSFRKVATIIGIAALGFATFGIGLSLLAAPALGAMGFGVTSGLLGLSTTTLGLIAAAGSLALSIGSMPGKGIEDTGANDRGTAFADPEALGCYVFGTTTVQCALVYEEVTGSSPDRVVHDVFAHAWHKINSYVSLTIGADDGPEVVTFSGNAATGTHANMLWWFRALGNQVAALSGAPFDNNSWPSSAIFEGVAHSAVVWNVDDDAFKDKFASVPTKLDIVAEGAMLYDPRLDPAYGSGSQDFGTPSGWTFNNGNASLVLLRKIIGEKTAGGALIWGRGAAENEIDMASFVAMANVSDETVDGKPRFRLGGFYSLDGSFEGFVRQWESETGGKLSKAGGVYRVWLPHDDLTPLTTLTEADLLAGHPVAHSVAQGVEGLFNTARGRYIEPTEGYRAFPYPEVSESSAVTDDGGKRILNQDFSWVQDRSIAERVARIKVRRSRFQRIWTIAVGWRGFGPNYKPFTVHTLNLKETGNNNETVRVIHRELDVMTGVAILTLQQEDASIYDDTIALGTPFASNTIPNRISQFGTITPRYVDGTILGPGQVVARARIYQRAAASPTLPSATVTYTFATGGMTGLNNGWTDTIPAGSNPLWISEASALTASAAATDDIAPGEWASPVILVENGADGADGAAGADGLNNAVVYLYRRSASSPATPSGTFTYTFATGVLSGGTPNGWTQAIPAADGNPLWVIAATASAATATDSVAAAEFTSPVIKDGAALNTATVILYRRSAGSPTMPSGTFTYTFSTGVLSGGTLNGWTQTVPAADGNPLWITTATALNTSATDSIAAAEFATAQVLAEDGADGDDGAPGADGADGINSATVFLYQRNNTGSAPSVPGSTLTYTFATGVLSGTLGSWTQTAPPEANGKFLFVTTATALSTTSTDNIATGEWATVRLMAQDGSIEFTPNLVNVTRTGSTYTKTGGTNNTFDSSVYSSEAYPRCAVSFKASQTNKNVDVGFDTNPSAAHDRDSIDYSIIPGSDGHVYTWDSVAGAVDTGRTYTTNDLLALVYDGAYMRWYQSATLLRTTAVPSPNTVYFLDSSFYETGAAITDLRFGPVKNTGLNELDPESTMVLVVSQPADATKVLPTISYSGGGTLIDYSVITSASWTNDTGKSIDVVLRQSARVQLASSDSLIGRKLAIRWTLNGGSSYSYDGTNTDNVNITAADWQPKSTQRTVTVTAGQTITVESIIVLVIPDPTSGDPADVQYRGLSLSIESFLQSS